MIYFDVAAERIMLRSRTQQAGVKSPCRPHGLRHRSATEVARRGFLAQLMSIGGWASMSAASRYLDERNEERLQALGLVELFGLADAERPTGVKPGGCFFVGYEDLDIQQSGYASRRVVDNEGLSRLPDRWYTSPLHH